MSQRQVIVFGPTGAVGSSTARTAGKLGAKVFLAMRDTSKPIPGLSAEQEKQGGYERVYADLSKADTVHDAVTKTKAKIAFFYLNFQAQDGMKPIVQALKSAGIEFVVFLSSFTIQAADLTTIPADNMIPHRHAQVELSLCEVFGRENFFAARPGGFASNSSQHGTGFKRGLVQLFEPKVKTDCIVPEDIGRVCGTVAAKGPQDDKRWVYLYGPQVLTEEQCVQTIAKVTGQSPKIEVVDEDAAKRIFMEERHLPERVAQYLVERTKASVVEGDQLQIHGVFIKEEELSNVEKYSGVKGTTFAEWVATNKHLFM